MALGTLRDRSSAPGTHPGGSRTKFTRVVCSRHCSTAASPGASQRRLSGDSASGTTHNKNKNKRVRAQWNDAEPREHISDPREHNGAMRGGRARVPAARLAAKRANRGGQGGTPTFALRDVTSWTLFAVLVCCANRHAPISTRRIVFFVIWVFISSSSSSGH